MSDFTIEIDREDDGRWIGEVVDLPGVLAYGGSRDEAVAKAKALAFRGCGIGVRPSFFGAGRNVLILRHMRPQYLS